MRIIIIFQQTSNIQSCQKCLEATWKLNGLIIQNCIQAISATIVLISLSLITAMVEDSGPDIYEKESGITSPYGLYIMGS
jgi:hypothetical protein